jgi:hypothetical protein
MSKFIWAHKDDDIRLLNSDVIKEIYLRQIKKGSLKGCWQVIIEMKDGTEYMRSEKGSGYTDRTTAEGDLDILHNLLE